MTAALGAAGTFRPHQVARANDTRGPRWLREFNPHARRPAYPGRTSPLLLRLVGVPLLAAGLFLLDTVTLDLLGVLEVT